VKSQPAVALRDGTEVELRPLERDDRQRLVRLFGRLSPETVYRRFLSPIRAPSEGGLDRLLDLDHREREAVAAMSGEEVVGVARYSRAPGTRSADLAVVVEDAWQGRGLSHFLLKRLTELARRQGIDRFTATIHSENRPAIGVLRRSFPAASFRLNGTEVEAELPLEPRLGFPAR